MDYLALVSETCLPTLAAEVQTIDLKHISGEDKLLQLMQSPTPSATCKSTILAYLSDGIHTATPPAVSIYFDQAARLVDSHSADALERIQEAATSIKIQKYPDSARAYFTALRVNKIDIRSYLSKTLDPDWNFTAPEAVTWQYYLYLANMDTDGAIEALARKISATENGNDATNFLVSLARLRTQGAKKVLERYKGDQRTADGTSGPGVKIDQTVAIYIDGIDWQSH